MIETSVTYVSAYTHRKVVRIDAAAIASGSPTAGKVPKTKRRMIRAPTAPMSVSVRTPGPLEPPCESKIASRPVRWLVTPEGVACFKAARASGIGGRLEKVAFPGG